MNLDDNLDVAVQDMILLELGNRCRSEWCFYLTIFYCALKYVSDLFVHYTCNVQIFIAVTCML